MSFINPIELLGLEDFDVAAVKKAKRRKLAEIELSDNGYIVFQNTHVDKSTFVSVTDELQDTAKLNAYRKLTKHKELTDFLTNGTTNFFEEIGIPSELYKTEILNLISIPFSVELDKQLLAAVKNQDVYTVKLLSQHEPILKPAHLDLGFKSTVNYLRDISSQLNLFRNKIENDRAKFNESNCEAIIQTIEKLIHLPTINALPKNLQGARNDVGKRIRNISVAVFNSFNDENVALELLKFTLQLKLDGITKNNIQKDYDEILNIKDRRDHNTKYAPTLKKYADKLVLSRNILKGVDDGSYDLAKVKSSLNSFLNIDELNGLPDLFQEIRNQIALAVRGVAVAVWNKFGAMDYSKLLMSIAVKINVDSDTRENLNAAQAQLQEVDENEYKLIIDALVL